jgi:hypothetical protein
VSEILLDFDLAAGLFLDFGLDDFGFVKTLEGENIFGFGFGADHVYTAEFALSKGPANVKTREVPFASWACSLSCVSRRGSRISF